MKSWLVRNLIFPVHERLMGRRTLTCWRELEASQWWAAPQIRTLQERKLRALLLHAWDRCPAHRSRLQRAGLARSQLGAMRLADLHALPLLDRGDIRENLDELVDQQVPGGAFRYTTGGSTGTPLIFYYDRRRQAYDQAARIRAHGWFGVALGERELYLWGAPVELSKQDRLKSLRDRLLNQFLLSAFNLSPETMERYLTQIRRFRPACLFGYPSTLALLAAFARQHGPVAGWPGLKAVFVTGEVLLPHQQSILEEVFQVPLANEYGARDAGYLAHQCPHGRMHLTAENVIVEIVDGAGRALAPGQSGEIVVTHLDNHALPFIRYRNGDTGRLSDERCGCGRSLPLLDVVEGRRTDLLVRADGARVHALALIYTLRDLPGVQQFKIHQRSARHVDVHVVRADGYAVESEQRIRREFGVRLGSETHVDIRYVSSIAPTGSGKYRYVVSDVADAAPQFEAACAT